MGRVCKDKLQRTRGGGRQSETAGMKTTSSKTKNNDSKENTFHQDEAEKTPPLMGQNMIQSSFAKVDSPQNIFPNSQMSLCNSQTDSHLQSTAQWLQGNVERTGLGPGSGQRLHGGD